MLYPNLTSKRIILASKSPRRLELVRGLELEPEVHVRDVDESYPKSVAGAAVAEYVTLAKAQLQISSLTLRKINTSNKDGGHSTVYRLMFLTNPILRKATRI